MFELFDAALRVPEADRVEFLRRECDDPEIREMVMRLLARDHEANLKDFLRPPGTTEHATPLFPMDPREAARRGHHLRCPHCREAIEVVGILANREVTCGVCRSTFRVDDDTPVSEDPESIPAHLGRFTLMQWLGEGSFGHGGLLSASIYRLYSPGVCVRGKIPP